MNRSHTVDVYGDLRAAVLGGRYADVVLSESGLAADLGVSRTPIREALARLQQENLIVRTDRGLVVRQIDLEELVELYDLRILLEGEAARRAATYRSDIDLARLSGLVARDRALEQPDEVTRVRTNLEFHRALWAASRNRTLAELLERVITYVDRVSSSTLSIGSRWDEALDEHDRLVRAIADGDAESAAAIAVDHMTTARSLRLKLIERAAGAS